MMRSSWRGFFALAAAFALFGVKTACGQYSVVGTTPGGGEQITGSGTNLGPLGPATTPVSLSSGGFDSVTIEPGASATASGTDTIVFVTWNNTLLNSGTIAGGAGYNAVTFLTSTNSILTGESITNQGVITVAGTSSITADFAGNTSNNQWGNNIEVALNITSGSSIGTITLSNTGSIIGGSIGSIISGSGGQVYVGYNLGQNDVGGNVAMGVAITSGSGIGTITLSNTGIITGGTIGSILSGSNDGAYVGYNGTNPGEAGANVAGGVDVTSGSGIGTITLSNTGVIVGGTIGSIIASDSGYINVGLSAGSYNAGSNVAVGVAVTSGSGITTLTLSNSGTITGGAITTITGSGGNVNVGYSRSNNDIGMNVAVGVAITSGSWIGTGTFFNSGTISGGSIGSITSLDGGVGVGIVSGGSVNEVGSNVAVGVAITSGSGIGTGTFSNTGMISGGSIGSILSGSGGTIDVGYNGDTNNAGGNVAGGLDVTSGTSIGTLFLTNSGTTTGGAITTISGSGGNIVVGGNFFLDEAGANVAVGASVTSGSSIGTVTLSNTSVITGGSITNISSTNGSVQVGSNFSSVDAGANVAMGFAVTSFASTGTVAITNAGMIAGGTLGSVTSGSAGNAYAGINFGSSGGSQDVGANVAGGLAITSGSGIDSVTLVNTGKIAGGTIGNLFGSGAGSNIYVGANTGIDDSAGGNVAGGVDVTSGIELGTVTLSSTGKIAGGTIGSIISGSGANVHIGYDGGSNNTGGNLATGVDVTSGIVTGTVTLSNTGTITGGAIISISGSGGDVFAGYNGGNDTGGNAAVGVAVTSGSGVLAGLFSNTGVITGGTIGSVSGLNGGSVQLGFNDGGNAAGGNVAVGVDVTSGSWIGTGTFINSGTIAGGAIGSISGSTTGDSEVGFNNAAFDAGGNVAGGVDVTSGSGIGTVILSNTGVIIGGSITSITGSGGNVDVGDNDNAFDAGSNVAVGVAVTSGNWIGTGTYSNTGSITGGTIGSISGVGGNADVGVNEDTNDVGGNVAVGVAVTSGSGIGTGTFSNAGAINGGIINTISNSSSGNVFIGYNGATSDAGGNVAGAFDVTSGTSIETLSITNSGTIAGGFITSISGSSNSVQIGGNFFIADVGANVAVGVDVTSGSGIGSVTLSNTGVITGGTIGTITSTIGKVYVGANFSSVDAGGNVAVGFDVTSGTSIGTVTITNSRTITGGGIGTITGASGGQTYVGTNFGFSFGSQDVGANVAGGVDVASGNGIGSVMLDNTGAITGGTISNITGNTSSQVGVGYNAGAIATGGNVASGFDVTSGSGITTLTLTNSGAITGGQLGTLASPNAASVFVGYNGGVNDTGGNLAVGIAVTSGSWLGTGTISNLSGTIAGGGINSITGTSTGSLYAGYNTGANDAGGNVTTGLAITSGSGMGTFTLTNEGMITGGTIGSINGFHNSSAYAGFNGNSNDVGGNVGVGLAITAGSTTGTFALTNSGVITGGTISSITGTNGATVDVGFNSDTNEAGGNVTTGIAITSGSGIGTLTLVNSGTITGGTIGSINGLNSASVDVGFNGQSNDVGGNVGVGLAITSWSTIGTVTLSNTGSITGGTITTISGSGGTVFVGTNASPNAAGANVATAVAISSAGGIGTLTLSNTGSITGGSIGSIIAANVGLSGSNDAGGSVAAGLNVSAAGAISNLTIVNSGSITGGSIGSVDNASTLGVNAAAAIVINSAFNAGGNLSVTNYGFITGGNVTSGAPAGYGIVSNAGQLVINNYGSISAGSGAAEAGLTPGYPAAAISVTGNNNTINLDGHSSVNGTLQGSGTNNVLNLNFTGVSPTELAALKSQLANQGWTPGAAFTGTFSLRGVTYFVDPLNVNLNAVAGNGVTPGGGAGVTSYEAQALTPNQLRIGANLDGLAYNPAPGTPLFALLNAIDGSRAVPQALEALSPQGYEIYGELAIAYANELALSVDRRLNNLRDGSESIDTGGFGGSGGGQTTAGYSKEDGKNIVQPSAPEKRWGFFASGLGMLYRGDAHDADVQQNGKSDSAGAIMGVDGKAGANAVIGGLVAYNSAGTTFGTEASTANIQSYTAGLYGSWHDGGFYVNTLAAYTRNNYSSTRNIVFPGFDSAAYGSTRGNQATLNVDGGYNWHVSDCLTLGPLVGLQYVNLGVDGFNELGGTAANLAVGRQEVNSLQSRLGVRADYHTEIQKNVALGAELSAEWQHEYLDNSRGIGADFIGSGLNSFSVETQSPQRDAAVLSTGVNFTFHDRLTLFSDYSLLIWNTSSIEQNFSAGMKISF